MKQTDIKEELYRASQLAEFANLEPVSAPRFKQPRPPEIQLFVEKYPEFAPEEWWAWWIEKDTQNSELEPKWKAMQRLLRVMWQQKIFSVEKCLELIVEGSDLSRNLHKEDTKTYEWVDDECVDVGAGKDVILTEAKSRVLMPVNTDPAPMKVWDYQRAIMFLYVQPWRAVFCMSCGKRFVKDAKGRLYCSETCYDPHRAEAKRLSERKRYKAKKAKEAKETTRKTKKTVH